MGKNKCWKQNPSSSCLRKRFKFSKQSRLKFTFSRRFLKEFTLSPHKLGSWPSTGTVYLLVAHRHVKDSPWLRCLHPYTSLSTERMQKGMSVHPQTAPFQICTEKTRSTLLCSFANAFPICRSQAIQRLLKPIMEKRHSKKPNFPFHIRCLFTTISKAHQVSMTSWKSKWEITKSCHVSICCAEQIPSWFLIHLHWCTEEVCDPAEASTTKKPHFWLPALSHFFSPPIAELWLQPHRLFSRNEVSCRKQVSVTKTTPTHGLPKPPSSTEGLTLFQRVRTYHLQLFFSKHNIRVASLSIASKTISDSSQ